MSRWIALRPDTKCIDSILCRCSYLPGDAPMPVHRAPVATKSEMPLKPLPLSLQWGRFDAAAAQRSALPRHLIRRWIRHALTTDAEITVPIVGADEGRQLNRTYRNKDYATNLLTFVYTQNPLLTPDAEITGRSAGADEGRQLNRTYRNKDYATNVLTFVYSQAPLVTADLLLCAPVIEREAQQQGKHLQAHYAHMLVHGTLHAQGWDHEGSADADAMQARETQIMQALEFTDPYAKQPG